MDHRQLNKQLLRITICELVSFVVPFTTLQIHAEAIDTISWLFLHVRWFHIISNDELEAESIDSYLSATGTVLHSACQESLWEEEA